MNEKQNSQMRRSIIVKSGTMLIALIMAIEALVSCATPKTPINEVKPTDGEETQITDKENPEGEEQNEEKTEDGVEKEAMPKLLSNTYAKLTNDKKLTAVFIGGSVTDGYGASEQSTKSWAAHTTNWFKTNFPDAQITGTKKSIGGTGSYLSAFRYEREIAPTNPDLLFIECAVNDKYNKNTYEQVVRSSESIVRKAYAHNPYIDIIYVLTFDQGDGTNDYDQLRAHRDVAEKYGLMCIKLSDYVFPMLKETGEEYNVYFKDGVHPNDKGYEYYASVITGEIGKDILLPEKVDVQLEKKVLPTETLAKNVMLNANMIYSDEIDLSKSHGWIHSKENYSWLGLRYNGRLFSSTAGAELFFEFDGTDFGIAYGIGSKMGKISCSVDGGEPIIIDAYRGNTNPKDSIVAWDIADGHHTAVIKLLDEPNSQSSGNEFEIGALLVN